MVKLFGVEFEIVYEFVVYVDVVMFVCEIGDEEVSWWWLVLCMMVIDILYCKFVELGDDLFSMIV